MKIATWNVNGLRARMDFVLHWLNSRQPDVVGLQELKMSDDIFPEQAFLDAGYHAVWYGQKSWNGVAILSKEPLEDIHRGVPGEDDFGSRLISARCGDFRFTTVYCPNGKNLEHADYQGKLAWYDSLIEYYKANHKSDEAHVLCGDFNICPTPADSWHGEAGEGEIFQTVQERERFNNLLSWGFEDTYRKLHPDTKAFSWWDYRAGGFYKDHGLRIDFVLGTAAIVDRVKSVEIDRDYRKKQEGLTASDHAPVIAEI